ncbi:MAG: DUF6011 domain-containing protein [Tissierellaceae bacterium]|nr:DUF6011 domain-containing protein [Tissierellaceae bacterium]
MLNLLEGYKGSVEVNGIAYSDLNKAIQAVKGSGEQLTIILNKGAKIKDNQAQEIQELEGSPIYKIKVRQYMTKPASPEFDFHDKWNNGTPMPMRIMVGRKLKETRGMVQMELWGEITEQLTHSCMKCGRTLTNPISKYFGIGPECGGHNYVNPFETDDELREAVKDMQEQLKEIKWTGWIIKSAIEEQEVVR